MRSSSAPARRAGATSTSRAAGGRGQHPHRHRLAGERLVRPRRPDRPPRHRARRRQHRHGLLPHRAAAGRRGRQGRRPHRLRGDEGVPLGEGGCHARGHPDPRTTSCPRRSPTRPAGSPASVREGGGAATRKAGASSCRPASPTCTCLRRRPDRHRPGERLPWIERDLGIEFDRGACPVVDQVTMGSTQPEGVLRRRRGLRPKNIIWAVAHGHEAAISIDNFCTGRDPPTVRPPREPESARRWASTSGATTTPSRTTGATACRWAATSIALKDLKVEVELGFDRGLGCRRRSAASTATCRPSFRVRCASSAMPASTSARWTASPSRRNGPEADLRTRLNAPAPNLTQDLYVSAPPEDRPRHGQGRGRVPPLRPVRRALPDRGLGHAEVPPRSGTHAQAGPACPAPNRSPRTTNDFVVKFANVNGSGSASANRLFARSILRMGVPVASRNIFPSNIQGLPTWYEVRVCEAGWRGRRGGVDLMVAMNPQTWDKDVAEIEPGGYLLYDSTRPMPPSKFRERRHGHRRAADRDLQPHLPGPTPAPALQEHPLCRRARAPARHRPGRGRAADRRAVQGQGQADRAQHPGAAWAGTTRRSTCRLLRAQGAPRRPRRRQDLHRRQRARRRWAASTVARRAPLVPDHALDLAGGGVRPALPRGSGSIPRPARTATPSSRPRTSSPPSAW